MKTIFIVIITTLLFFGCINQNQVNTKANFTASTNATEKENVNLKPIEIESNRSLNRPILVQAVKMYPWAPASHLTSDGNKLLALSANNIITNNDVIQILCGLKGRKEGVAFSNGHVYLLSEIVYRINYSICKKVETCTEENNCILQKIGLENSLHPSGLEVANGKLYVFESRIPSTIAEYSMNGTRLRTVELPNFGTGGDIAWDGTNFWVVQYVTTECMGWSCDKPSPIQLYRIDPDLTFLDSHTIPEIISNGPFGITWEFDSLWISDSQTSTLYQLNIT